jgi:hypothetical protein
MYVIMHVARAAVAVEVTVRETAFDEKLGVGE